MKNPTPRPDSVPTPDDANSVIESSIELGEHVPFRAAIALGIKEMDVLAAVMAKNEDFSNDTKSKIDSYLSVMLLSKPRKRTPSDLGWR